MSAAGLEGIDHAFQQAHTWINELDGRSWGSLTERPRRRLEEERAP